MRSEWRESHLGTFAPLTYGRALPERVRQTNGDIPVYGSNGIVGSHNTALANSPGIIVGRKGTVGSVYYSDRPFWSIDTTFYVAPDPSRDLRFTYYLLKTLGLENMNSDSAVPGLNRDAAHARKVLIPPLSEQRAIASILGSLDDKIELNHRMNETLEAIAQALFKSWFVDFDPVRAKAESRELYGMDSETAALFPDGFQESKLGFIPQGWESAPLSARIEILSGGTPKTGIPQYWNGSIPWVSVVDTTPGPYIIQTEKTVSELGVQNSAAKILPSETIVLTARGTVGNCALMAGPMAMNQSCYGLRGQAGVGQLFLFHHVREQVNQLRTASHGSVFSTITRQTFDTLRVVWPPTECIAAFDAEARPLFDRILLNQRESSTLASIRDTLLPKLMSGEIRVREVETLMEAQA